MVVELSEESLGRWVREQFGSEARLVRAGKIGSLEEQGIKNFGYGKPLLVQYEVAGSRHEVVVSVMRGDKYGHQYYWDRAAVLMFQHETGSRLSRHAKPVALGYVDKENVMHPVQAVKEFFVATEKLQGYDYYLDLRRIQDGDFRESDLEMARSFARWLAEIHSEKLDNRDLYYRRIRNLIGSDECILGLVDEAYPRPYPEFSPERFRQVEHKLVDWRWKLENYHHRLSVVHGDFHPWNVLVTEDGDFRVLDRSRGEWGEPAGDVACMAINYMLFGLLDTTDPTASSVRLEGPFEGLFTTFFSEYLRVSKDAQCLAVMAPFFVFRALVIASPEWYPNHPPNVRSALFRFVENVLEDASFDPANVNLYLR